MPQIEDYQHIRGVHCASMALRNMVRHETGTVYSEAMCFGLSAGLNFTYGRLWGAPFILTMGRGSYLEDHFCDVMGVQMEGFRSDDPALGWRFLREHVDRGQLVIIDADMFHLPYMVQKLGLMDGVHFGGHKLLITGYDDATQTVQAHDYAWGETLEMTYDELEIARNSAGCPSPPRNYLFYLQFPDELPALSEVIPLAIVRMVNLMKYPFYHHNGLKGIDRFCRQITRWPRLFEPEELLLNTKLAAFMMEKAGSGGGNFRNLYQRFLRESARAMGASELDAAADLYHRLARKWREAASLMAESAEDPSVGMYDPSRGGQMLLREIVQLEQQGVADLEAFTLTVH